MTGSVASRRRRYSSGSMGRSHSRWRFRDNALASRRNTEPQGNIRIPNPELLRRRSGASLFQIRTPPWISSSQTCAKPILNILPHAGPESKDKSQFGVRQQLVAGARRFVRSGRRGCSRAAGGEFRRDTDSSFHKAESLCYIMDTVGCEALGNSCFGRCFGLCDSKHDTRREGCLGSLGRAFHHASGQA